MFIAMNRFPVKAEEAETFEKVWKERESHLHEMEGFQKFKMLKGPEKDGVVLYASHVEWDDRSCFDKWVNSDQFKAAHRNSNMPKGVILGHPNFEGFEVILEK